MKHRLALLLVVAATAVAVCPAHERDQGRIGPGMPSPEEAKSQNDTFIVFWDVHYGYRLSKVDDTDTLIIPEFIGIGVEKEFDDFFASDEFARSVGKKVYCDCSGELYQRDGALFYRIETARIFAK